MTTDEIRSELFLPFRPVRAKGGFLGPLPGGGNGARVLRAARAFVDELIDPCADDDVALELVAAVRA